MTAPAKPDLRWTHSVCVEGWVGDVPRPVLLGWDVAWAGWVVVSVTDPDTDPDTAVDWWTDRCEIAKGVDGSVGDWMWQCTRDGEPYVAIRPLTAAEPILVREDALGRFLAVTEWYVPLDGAGFDAEAAELLGGAS